MLSLAAEDPYVRQFSATVVAIDGAEVRLDETYFYPEAGGQPADVGTIDGVEVIDVQHRDGTIVHELDGEPAFDTGDTVEASIDDERRRYTMRAHTASHVLYGAARRLLDDLGYGGFDISQRKVRVDFDTSTTIDDDVLVELERLTNRTIWDAREVSWEVVSSDDALERDDVAFNTKTKEGVDDESVRIVTVEDWDVAACGGTHVRNTIEVGPVTVLDRSNPGEGLTRVEFAVGPAAIEARAGERTSAMHAAELLDTGVEGLPDAVAGLQADRRALHEEAQQLREELAERQLSALRDDRVEKGSTEWLVGTLASADANELAERAQSAVDGDGDVVALVGEDGRYLAVATGGAVDAGGVVETVTDEFGGGGGGGSTVAQGGGLDTDPERVVAFIREIDPVR